MGEDKPVGAVNISQVAARAGVSRTTVSHTMNRPSRVAAATRAKVLAVIDELGYFPPQSVGRGGGRTARIAVVAPFSAYSSFHDRLDGLLSAAREADRPSEIVLVDHDSAARTADPQLSVLPLQGRVDGVVVMGLPVDDTLAERLLRNGLPTVLVDSHHPRLDTVTMSDELGGRMAARRLMAAGLRHFLYVSEGQLSTRYLSTGQRRMQGFRAALEEAGIEATHFRHRKVPEGLAAAEECGRALARAGRQPLGIFAHHDRVAVGLLNGLRAQRAKVPGEFWLVGFDGRELARAAKLTTVRQPLQESGALGLQLLLRRLADPSSPVTHTRMNVDLLEGETA